MAGRVGGKTTTAINPDTTLAAVGDRQLTMIAPIRRRAPGWPRIMFVWRCRD